MAMTHALVVDDSRSARVALQKLLEEHDLRVSLAESGEQALEFLKKHAVDVIFMDHTMPGMDGLEAVAAIKANPDTATIPVMMYTTREGEVYVGQARALGAVGVMPKNVQPHQLFEMLASLGLVKDRREQDEPLPEGQADRRGADYWDGDRDLEDRALGMSVQALVTRILEDQHLTLRSDILRSQRTFAKEVAKEIILEQARADDGPEDIEEPAPRQDRYRAGTGLAIVAVVILGFLAWQFKAERDMAVASLAELEAEQARVLETEVGGLQTALEDTTGLVGDLRQRAIQALTWAVNDANAANMDEFAFNTVLSDKVGILIEHLEQLGFKGEVRLTSHLGRFCLTVDEIGGYRLAPPDRPALECDYTGHVLEQSSRVSERLSVPFSRLYRERTDTPLRLELVALDGSESEVRVDYPDSTATAGEWNAIARLNNRVEIALTSDPVGASD